MYTFNLKTVFDGIGAALIARHAGQPNGGNHSISIICIKDETKKPGQMDCFNRDSHVCILMNVLDLDAFNMLNEAVWKRFLDKYDDKGRYHYAHSIIIDSLARELANVTSSKWKINYFISSDGTDKLICFYEQQPGGCVPEFWQNKGACQCDACCLSCYRKFGCPMCGTTKFEEEEKGKKRERQEED